MLANFPGVFPQGQHQVLTPEARAELKRVQDMQIRTQAVQFAVILHQPRATSDPRLMKTCKVIEEYIREGTFNGDPLSSI